MQHSISAEKWRMLHGLERQGQIYILPTVLAQTDRRTRRQFTDIQSVQEELFRQLSVFPLALLQFWTTSQRGQLVISSQGAEYNPATRIARASVQYLRRSIGIVEEEITHLLDHLLGSSGRGPRMSEGYGITPRVEQAGRQLQAWFEVKRADYYNRYAATNEREYLAQGVRAYLHHPDPLQANDEDLFLFVRDQFLAESFWESVL